jgi:N-acetylneuraminic acid mutarotase
MADQQEIAFAVGGAIANRAVSANVQRFDGASGVWREGSPMAAGRAIFGLCTLDGAHYAIGGMDAERKFLASVERYSASLDSWNAAPPLPQGRANHCAVAVGNAMYVMGGAGTIDGLTQYMDSVLKFDNSTQAWSAVAPMPEARSTTAACVVGSEIYVLGGIGQDRSRTATTYRYNVTTNAWSTPRNTRGSADCKVKFYPNYYPN